MIDSRLVQADFDRIALLPPAGFDHSAHYHEFLLRFLPARLGEALELGCGAGRFTRLLAARADRVCALDLSANMISVARGQSAGFANIDFRQGDALRWDWPAERFDCVVSIATLHHLPMEETLRKMKTALRPGGILLVLDLWRTATAAERLLGGAGLATRLWLNLLHTGRLRATAELRRAWREHAKTDRYLSLAEVRRAVGPILPGAAVRRHLLWRYSVVWRKPTT